MPDTSYLPMARVAFGDVPLRDGPAANVVIERVASDDHAYLRDATLTTLDWSGDLSVDPLGTAGAFLVRVGAISAVTLRDAAGAYFHVRAYGGGTVGPAKTEGGGGTLGAVARWWCVYAFLNGAGLLDFELSTVPPNGSRRLKSTDPTRRYLGCFSTDANGAPLPVDGTHGRYLYRSSACNGADFVVGSGAGTSARPAPGVWTGASLAGLVPPWARKVRLWCFVRRAAADGAAVLLDLRTPGDAGLRTAAVATYSAAMDTLGVAEVAMVVPAQVVEYALSAAVTAVDPYGARLAVAGWDE
jgi:hypothetical protein